MRKGVYNANVKNIEDKVATKASLNAKINEVKGEIPNINKLAINASFNDKINGFKGEIPSITNLATTTALTAVENKRPNTSNLAKKTDYNMKTSEIEKKITDYDHDKYITTPEFNKFTAKNFAARLAQANLASKNEIANFLKRYSLIIN